MGLSSAVAGAVGVVARARHGSAIHEVGTVYDGRWRATGAGAAGGPFGGAGERRVTVRVSRAIGLPAPLPDVFGLGLRLDTPDGPQDLLLDSCAPGRLGRHSIVLRRDLCGGPLGSLLALTDGTTTFHLAAFPRRDSGPVRDTAAAAGLAVVLATARPYGRWTAVGVLHLDTVAADQGLRLCPAHAALGVRLSPRWEQFRVRAYRASRAAATR